MSTLEQETGSVGRIPVPTGKWRTRVLLPGAVLLAAAALLAYTGREALRPALDVEVVPVVVKTASAPAPGDMPQAPHAGHVGNGAVAAQAPGWIEPDPYPINVAALADGVVKDILVLEGQRVEAGQTVARLVDDDARLALTRAEAEARGKMADVVVAEADLKHAKMLWDNPVEVTRAAGVATAALAEVRAELARLPLEIAAESARYDVLQDELKRKEGLVATRAVAEGDVVQLRLRIKAQEAMLNAVRARQPMLEAKMGMAEAELAAAKDNLRLRAHDTRDLAQGYAMVEVKKAAQAQADAAREEARLRLDRMDVKAPAAGIVMTRVVAPGSKVVMGMDDPASSWVVRIYDPRKLQVRVDVPLASAGQLGVGQAAEVTVEVLPGKVFHGKVTRLVQEANIQKNTVQVKVSLDDPAPELKPEMLTRVKLFAPGGAAPGGAGAMGTGEDGAATGVLLAPAAMLVAGATGIEPGATARAWVVDQARGEACLREVTLGGRVTGMDDGQAWMEVTQGLRPGDRLIAGDVSRLREGVKVRVVGEKEGGHGVH